MTYRAGILALVLSLTMPWLAMAETIVLNSGKIVKGKIVRQDKESVALDLGIEGAVVTYYRDAIKQILPDDVPAVDVAAVPAASADPAVSVDKLEEQAVTAIDDGDVDKGLALMVKVIQMDPTPIRHMNYASILFGNGVSAFKGGQQTQGLDALHQSEAELTKAIAGFDKNKDAINLSQCYFLLGEMYLNAFNDKDKAKDMYQKAVSFYDHPAAGAALKKFTST